MKKLFDKIRKNNKGFTLVELIVVIAVLAIITVVVAPQYIKYVEKARVGTDENALGEIAHIAEVEFVELAANGLVNETNGETLTVQCSGDFAIKEETELAKAVEEIMGSYTAKSKTYKDAGEFTITISGDGIADYDLLSGNKAGSESTQGGSTEGGNTEGGNTEGGNTEGGSQEPVKKICSNCKARNCSTCDHSGYKGSCTSCYQREGSYN